MAGREHPVGDELEAGVLEAGAFAEQALVQRLEIGGDLRHVRVGELAARDRRGDLGELQRVADVDLAPRR